MIGMVCQDPLRVDLEEVYPPSEVYPCSSGVPNNGGYTSSEEALIAGAAGAEFFLLYGLLKASLSAFPIRRAYIKCIQRLSDRVRSLGHNCKHP